MIFVVLCCYFLLQTNSAFLVTLLVSVFILFVSTKNHQLTTSSYSRQNLLSNKSNEGFQNTASTSERSNNSTMEWPEVSSIKLNSVQRDSTNSSEATTPRHRRGKAPTARAGSTVPPDVLNVNQIQKIRTDFSQFLMGDTNDNEAEAASFVHVGFNETCSNNSNGSEEFEFKDGERNRNEWRDDGSTEQLPR